MTSPAANVAVCPNEACGYRIKFGRPAEYRSGFDRCSDCGGALAQGAEEVSRLLAVSATPMKPKGAATARRLPWARLAVTALGPLAVLLVSRVPIPGLDPYVLGEFVAADANARELLSIGSLWITPFVLAFGVVETVAALVPRWQRLRTGGPEGRAALGHVAAVLGTVFAVIQALGIARWLESVGSDGLFDPTLAPAIIAPGPASALVVTLTLAGTVVALAWVAGLITRFGVGNGWAVLLVSAWSFDVATSAPAVWAYVSQEVVTPLQGVLLVAAHAGAAFLTVHLFRSTKDTTLRAPVGGVTAAVIVPPVVASAAAAVAMAGVGMELSPNGWALVGGVLVVPVSVGFALLWNQPTRVGEVLARTRAFPSAREAARDIRLRLPRAVFISAAFCAALVAAPAVYNPLALGAISLVATATAVTILVDLWHELRAWRAFGRLVPVWPLHRVYAVRPTVTLLKEAGIDAFVRGERFRVLYPFLDSYVPAEVMVPEREVERAQQLIRSALTDESSPAAIS